MKPKSKSFSQSLMLWYRGSARELPWRETQDPYKIWISEIMLQQTTVNAVIPFYEKWITKFPDVQSVASSSPQTILKHWQGLGYYSRARNIHKTAKIIAKEFNSVFPQDVATVRGLPGFGPYTTGAVLSIAFDQRQPIIDANVRRVVMRQLRIEGKATPANDKRVLGFLLSVMPQKNNRIFNQAMMELGALICKSKNPSCLACPVRSTCLAYKDGVQDLIPTPKKVVIKDVQVSISVICEGDKFYIQKRAPKGLFADLWEFPGGKVEPGETPHAAMVRAVMEETGMSVETIQPLPQVIQFYTQFRATLHVWLCRAVNPLGENKMRKWVNLKSMAKYPMAAGSAKIAANLLKI